MHGELPPPIISGNQPLTISIRGRGNSSWTASDKKPYKIKFNKKTSILNLPANKHFILQSFYAGFRTYAQQIIGFELAKLIELGWTASYVPVELVLNGDYRGLYFLFESNRIHENRLNIYEQPDNNIDPETIPYGWLVEVDNYKEENSITVTPTGQKADNMNITYHSPKNLSTEQLTWLTDEFTHMAHALNGADARPWEEYLDPVTLLRSYIVREVMTDYDGYNGSIYLYRDLGDNSWKSGPIWDCGIWVLGKRTCWTYENLPSWSRWKIIPYIKDNQIFTETFRNEWQNFYPGKLAMLRERIIDLAKRCEAADLVDRERWGFTVSTASAAQANWLCDVIDNHARWIDERVSNLTYIPSPADLPSEMRLFDLQGRQVTGQVRPGLYVDGISRKLIRIGR